MRGEKEAWQDIDTGRPPLSADEAADGQEGRGQGFLTDPVDPDPNPKTGSLAEGIGGFRFLAESLKGSAQERIHLVIARPVMADALFDQLKEGLAGQVFPWRAVSTPVIGEKTIDQQTVL